MFPFRPSSLVAFLLLLVLTVAGCGDKQSTDVVVLDPTRPTPTISLLGEELDPVPLSDEVKVEFEANLAAALADFVTAPEDVETVIWLGRRLAYLGRYHEAIDTYTQGIREFPDEPRLYRHRGHRYITTRQIDKAITDLRHAADLVADQEDQVEPDGLPNDRGIPTSTLHSNIWYHLGLAHYLEGNFDRALEAYRQCLEVSQNPDMLVATSHWLYMTLRRLDLLDEAERVLQPIDPSLDIIENHEYHQLLLMYRGLIPLSELSVESAVGLSSATLGYGVANWYLYNGNQIEADRAFSQILETDQWAAFGYLAAEAEIARATGRLSN